MTDFAEDEGRCRSPSLRNVAVTAPYMHDGSVATLEAVILDHYAIGGFAAKGPHGASPLRDPLIAGFKISDAEIADTLRRFSTYGLQEQDAAARVRARQASPSS